MALTTKRIIALPSQNDPQEGDYLAIDNMQSGTHKIPVGRIGVEVDDTLTEAGEAADAKAVGDALDGISSQVEVTGTASGAIATFTDGADMPAKSVIVNIEPQQSGSGTPSPENVRQISGWESVSVDVCGKNFLNLLDFAPNGEYSADGSSFTAPAAVSTNPIRLFNQPTNITVSFSSCATSINGLRFRFFNEDTVLGQYNILASGDSYTINNCTHVAITHGSAGGNPWTITEPMIRLASDTDATFAPYNGHTTTTPLGRTVYGGTLDVVSGVLTVDRAIVDGGSLNWTYWYDSYFYAIVTGKTADTTTDIMCDIYPTTNGATGTNGIFNVVANKTIAYICDTELSHDASGAAALETKLSGHSIAYKLATPQTYTLTGQEINTLLGDNNVWADCGDVEVVYVRDLNIAINNLLNSNGTRSLGMMAMSATAEATTEEPTDEQSDEDMR